MKLKTIAGLVGRGVGGIWGIVKKYAFYSVLGVLVSSLTLNAVLAYRLERSQSSLESILQHNERLTTTIATMEATEQYRRLLGDSLNTSIITSIGNEYDILAEVVRIQEKGKCPCEPLGASESDSSTTQYIGLGEGVKQPPAPLQTAREALDNESNDYGPNRRLTDPSIRLLNSGIQRHRETTE